MEINHQKRKKKFNLNESENSLETTLNLISQEKSEKEKKKPISFTKKRKENSLPLTRAFVRFLLPHEL